MSRIYDNVLFSIQRYSHILEQNLKNLETAQRKLTTLRKTLKKAQAPEALLSEIDSALELINNRLQHLQQP